MKLISVLIIAFALFSPTANAQKESKYGTDSVNCVINISLYQEYYKQDNYADAFGPWKKLLRLCPQYSKNLYLHGETMLKEFIDKESDSTNKQSLVDTLMFLYAKRIQYYGQEGIVSGKMGIMLYDNRPEKLDRINELFEKSIELEGDKTDPTVLFRFFQVKTLLYHRDKDSGNVDKVDKEDILESYDVAATIADHNIDGGSKYAKNYQISKDNIETLVEPFISCPDIREIYFSKVEKNPDDVELLKKLVNLLTKRNCLTEDFYLDVATRLYKKEPAAESAVNLARMYSKKGDYLIAMDYYNDAVRLQTNNSDQAIYNLEMAEIEFRQFKNYSKARMLALKAAKANPKWGKPYILIGDLYASSSKVCGDDNSIGSKAVFWAAEDKYQQAKAIDPSEAEVANNKISTYKKYYPKKEELFFENLQSGQPYKIGCWIEENTIIRTVD